MAADLIIERIQRDLVLVTFRVMLLMDAVTIVTVVAILVQMVMILILMMMMVVVVMSVMIMDLLSLETRRTTRFCPGTSQVGCATGLDTTDTGIVMTGGELLLMMILQVRREFVGGATFRR